MSCADCEKAQESGFVAPYRWKNANVLVIGCRVHVGEMFKALSAEGDADEVREVMRKLLPMARAWVDSGNYSNERAAAVMRAEELA